MRRAGNRRAVALALPAAAAVLALAIPPAAADRAPTSAERAAIKRAALTLCNPAAGECEFRRGRVSTRNARYAWAAVIDEGLSGALLERRTAHARRFRVVGVQGGGINTCAYWRKRAPRGVLRDLRISGLVDADTGAVRNCGRRR